MIRASAEAERLMMGLYNAARIRALVEPEDIDPEALPDLPNVPAQYRLPYAWGELAAYIAGLERKVARSG